MKIKRKHIMLRTLIGFFAGGLLVVSFGSASLVGPVPVEPLHQFVIDPRGTDLLKQLAHLDLLQEIPEDVVEDLLAYQSHSGLSLAQIIKNPKWAARFGLNADAYKATWYAANPFDLLPKGLQQTILKTSTPFESRKQINQWCQTNKISEAWVRALDAALIETTPINLWRASRGKRPFAKNGQYLEPIVVDRGRGNFDVRDGHIATDPEVIPTNSRVLLVVRVNGEERLIRAKATDIGSAIKGRHVDLPIVVKSNAMTARHSIRFPKEYIRNPTVMILRPAKKVNRGQKA